MVPAKSGFRLAIRKHSAPGSVVSCQLVVDCSRCLVSPSSSSLQMSTYQIRKYEAGSAEAKVVSVSVDGDVLRIVDSGETIPLSDLDLDVGGHLGDRIKLKSYSTGLLLVADDRALLDALSEADGDGPLALKARNASKKLTALPHAHRRYWIKIVAVSLIVVLSLY